MVVCVAMLNALSALLRIGLGAFDVYFPSPCKLLDSALRLLYAWAGFYNNAKIHLSFGEPLRGIVGFTELERLTVLAQKG